jgi:RNA polymerase sigma factor for flagellar operon FliA
MTVLLTAPVPTVRDTEVELATVESAPVPTTPVRLSAAETSAMIERNLPLVQHVLYQVAAHYPRHADREELAQAATLGLVEAAHRYDPSRGVPFERWAAVRVRGAIVDAARALDFAPRSLRAAAREVEEATSALLNKFGRTPTGTELANHLNISGRELAELQGKVHRALVLSLDAPCGEEDGDPLTLADGLIETSDIDPSTQIEDREQAAYLRDALELLPDRLQVVVKGYFLEGRTSADLAEELSVTESRVSQMRSEGLALMRAGLQAQFDGSDGLGSLSAGQRESSRAAARKAAYSAALATHSSYVGRLGRRVPTQRTAPMAAAV